MVEQAYLASRRLFATELPSTVLKQRLRDVKEVIVNRVSRDRPKVLSLVTNVKE